MIPDPYISVVIPTYNRADSLLCTLYGLDRQSYPKQLFEVIVVNDGSTDATASVLQRIADETALNLKAVQQNNSGPGMARNNGAKEATGEIILYIDDDIEPDALLLETHAAHHKQNDNVVVIGPMSPDPALAKSEPMWIAWEHAMLQKSYANMVNGVWPVIGPNLFYSGNASLRRDQLLAIGGFDTSFKRQEDVEMAVRLHAEFKVEFRFDLSADGVHRPKRTFESWYRVPYSYGQYDVIRYKRGDLSPKSFFASFQRHGITQFLGNVVLSMPFLSTTLCLFMRCFAHIAWTLGSRAVSLHVLSAVYNIRYMEGAAAEIGQRGEVIRIMRQRPIQLQQ